jgi:hypothetical protein
MCKLHRHRARHRTRKHGEVRLTVRYFTGPAPVTVEPVWHRIRQRPARPRYGHGSAERFASRSLLLRVALSACLIAAYSGLACITVNSI